MSRTYQPATNGHNGNFGATKCSSLIKIFIRKYDDRPADIPDLALIFAGKAQSRKCGAEPEAATQRAPTWACFGMVVLWPNAYSALLICVGGLDGSLNPGARERLTRLDSPFGPSRSVRRFRAGSQVLLTVLDQAA